MNESDFSHASPVHAAGAAASPSARLIALSELQSPLTPGGPVLAAANPLHQIKARLQVCVGEADMTIGELLGAREHQVIALDRTVDQPVDLTLDGKVIARGQLVAVGDSFGIRLTELPLPLQL